MVAQFPVETAEVEKVSTPIIQVDVNTFTSLNPITADNTVNAATRMCSVNIVISNIKTTLAVGTFSRVFAYAQNLANNDVNPISNISNSSDPSPNFPVTKPETGIVINIDKSQTISTCNLTLKINNLRLDYMDEYFNRTLAYLTQAIQNDLNP